MAKKTKKRAYPMPKLSVLDMLIYVFAMIFVAGSGILCVILPAFIRDALSISDPNTISCTTTNFFFGFPMGFWFFAMFCLIAFYFSNRQPIFGRKDVKYGPPTYPPKYPLIHYGKPKHFISEKQKKRANHIRIVSCLSIVFSFIFCILLYPGILWYRSELQTNGNLVRYGLYNSPDAEYANEEISCVRLTTYDINGASRSRKYISFHPRGKSIQIVIETNDGHSAAFKLYTFRDEDGKAGYISELKAMLLIKELYIDRFTIEDEVYMAEIISGLKLNAEETELLYELFQQ